ncbi:MAG: hypothetical protein KF900_06875 [Bacteroidetes bacterium]|nr:hypothetical protein [Bacteroidota bacterium]
MENEIFNKLKTEVLKKVMLYNALFLLKMYSENTDEIKAYELKLADIEKWFLQKGVEIKKSRDMYIACLPSRIPEHELMKYEVLSQAINKEVKAQNYDKAIKFKTEIKKLYLPPVETISEDEFYKTHNVLTYIDVFHVQRNVLKE